MIRLINLITLFVLFSSLPFSLSAQNEGEKVLKIMGDRYSPPYEYVNREQEPIGFNIDLIKEIMKRLDLPYKIELEFWNYALDSWVCFVLSSRSI